MLRTIFTDITAAIFTSVAFIGALYGLGCAVIHFT